MNKYLLIAISAVLVLFLSGAGLFTYRAIYTDNVQMTGNDSEFLHLQTGTDLSQCLDSLRSKNLLHRYWTFHQLAGYMGLGERTISGRYEIEDNMSNIELIRMFRSGEQAPVDVLIRPVRTREALAKQLGRQLEATPETFDRTLDTVIERNRKLDTTNLLAFFIPNTYQMYWNNSPEKVYNRLFSEYENFWDRNNREIRAEELGFTPTEIYTLASIVDRETNVTGEKSTIAGVYLNRLKRNMPLQADPTVVYAIGDFSLKRVLHKHLEVESPYNTYKYPGLPPGPIGMATIEGIDAVLSAQDHNYLYFCAKANGDGEHVFATNLQSHLRNARKFHRWLNEQERLGQRE